MWHPDSATSRANLQQRTTPPRLVADRPFTLEVGAAVSDTERVIGSQAHLRRLRAAQDTCQAPGASPVIASAPIEIDGTSGGRIRVAFPGLRLPAGRSRLCFFVSLPVAAAQQPRGQPALSLTPADEVNELELVLDLAGGGSSPGPAAPPRQLPTVTVTAPDANAAESPLDTGALRVSRTGATTAALTVSFTVGGTATSGADYDGIGTSVTIPAGSSTADITVTPINDTDGEDPETVKFTLAANAAYTVGSPSNATVTITSEDQRVQGGGVNRTEGPEGNVPCPASGIPTTSACPVTCPAAFDGTIFEITLKRIGSTAAPLDVIYTLDGTATANFDYFFRPQRQPPGQPTQRVVTVPAGASQVKGCVITVANTSHESNPESLTLTILPDPAYTVGNPSTRTLTILDDD